MRPIRMLALGASLLVLASACATGGGGPTVRIGSAGFYEARLMGELYAQVLEANGYTVERKLGLGARPIVQQSIQSGAVNLVPEYIGSALEYLNQGRGEATGDPAATAAKLQEYLAPLGITVLDHTPGQDQNGFAVRRETAQRYGLRTMSDLGPVSGELILGAPPECEANPICLPGLKATYGIEFGEFKRLEACSPDGITALVEGAIDVYEVCTTQPGISQFDLVLLEDDGRLQPAENIAPIVRDELLEALADADAFVALLRSVSERLDTETLLALGVEVDVDKRDVADVAREWLTSEGLLP
jgi:osmoprotectant transport system substrate-binding protein